MSLQMYLTRCRIWWRAKKRLHKTLVILVMVGFCIVPFCWLAPSLVTGCIANFILWFALFVIGTVPGDTLS